ncbi:hypothetical protein, partial [Alistipes shahii]|uniref:hypothetical protein n=1 Tax=Alistipes shahii TaxID=328814 RepID=UPI003AAFA787
WIWLKIVIRPVVGGKYRVSAGKNKIRPGFFCIRRIDYSRRRRAEGKRSAKLRFLRVFSIFTACI